MKKRHLFLFLMLGLMVVNSCKKERSQESGNGPSVGTLQDDGSGDCLPKTVSGAYVVGVALVGSVNYIDVEVNVTTVGNYTIYTDTVNGMYFRVSGIFTTTGLNTVRLRGFGTPAGVGITNFVVNYGSSACTIAVTTVASLAVFTLNGSPGSCAGAVPAGTYAAGTILNASNTITINVTVTTAGAYNISTVVSNGITFSGFGTLAVGPQTIILTGAGTPTSPGNTNIPVAAGGTNCGVTLNVGGAAAAATYTINCASAVPNGIYTQNSALTAANTITITVDVATAGTYTITGTVNGMTFSSAAGASFAAAGAGQTVTLNGTGTPTVSGANTVPLSGGTAGCSVNVTVNPPAAGAAVFTVNCAPAPSVAGTYTQGTALGATNTVTINVTVTAIGTYSVSTSAVNGMTFSSAPGASFTVTGAQSVILTGSGNPPAGGMFNIPVPSAACNFLVYVGPGAAATDYFPRVTNNNWSYEIDDDATDSFYRKVVSPPVTILANSYNVFMFDDGSGFDSSGYYRKNGGDYFEYLDVGSFIGYDDPLRAEYIMLKDNVAAGANWKSAGYSGTVTIPPPQALTLRFSYTILQKDVPITLVTSTGSITYQNVIVVEEKYEQFTGGIWVDVTALIDFYGKSYYARGIGLIKYEALDALNIVQAAQELRRYVVY